MSVHVSSWVWRNTKSLRVGIRMVLVRIADMANDEGVAWPSLGTLAEDVNKTRRQIMNDIKELERLGLITKTGQTDGSGRSRCNLYRIVMDTQPVEGRVKPISPSQGEAHFTLPVKPTSPSEGEAHFTPLKRTVIYEPSSEPTPLTPRSGGDGLKTVDALEEITKRLWSEKAIRLTTRARREAKHRLRAGETPAEVFAWLADVAGPVSAAPAEAWEPPFPPHPQARLEWERISSELRERMSPTSWPTWIYPLRPVSWRDRGGIVATPGRDVGHAVEISIAGPDRKFQSACRAQWGEAIAKAAADFGAELVWWEPSVSASRPQPAKAAA